MNKNLWPDHCRTGRGKSMAVKLNPMAVKLNPTGGKLSLLIIDTQMDFMEASVSSYELIRWSKDKVVLQVNPPDKFDMCPEKATMGERIHIGSELISIKDLPNTWGFVFYWMQRLRLY
jgi:hypothetical protein